MSDPIKSALLKGRLAAIVGAVAAAALIAFTPTQEGTVYVTYKDLGGVLTYCDGATENAIWGKTYTPAECKAQLDYDLARHAEGISHCVDINKLTDGQKVAFVDTAYNIGIRNFCTSSMMRLTNANDMAGACAALKRWVKVGDKVIRGLVNRRDLAYAFCMKGLP
jgi:lysozyme